MPVPGVYPGNPDDPAPKGTAPRTLTAAGNPDSLSPGVIGAVVTVPVLVVICMVAAATLHQLRCMNPRCKVCCVLRCRRRKPRNGRAWDNQLSNLRTPSKPFDEIPDTLEKSGFDIPDFPPLDQQSSPAIEVLPTLVIEPQVQEISRNKPRHINTDSAVSSVALTSATPYTVSTPATSTAVSTLLGPTDKSAPGTMVRSAGGEEYSPSDFDTRPRSRCSQTSGLLSIITLPSFIANDRPRTYNSTGGVRIESPVRPPHHHKHSSIDKKYGGTDTATPVSPDNDQDTVAGTSKGDRPTSGTLQIITSALKRRSSSSSTRSTPTSSRRSSRRFPARSNLSQGVEDEAVIEWMRLPPLPSTYSSPAAQTSQTSGATGTEDLPTERLPSYCEEEPKQPDFLAPFIPLPPSPVTPASAVSSLAYALPSPAEISPMKGITTPYTSYPPPLPSVPPAPGPSSHPPAPRPADRFRDTHTTRSDSIVSLAISTLRRLSGGMSWIHSDSNPPTTATPALPGNNRGSSSHGLNEDGTRPSIYRGSTFSAFSQRSTLLSSPPSLLASPSSPSRPMSPRGPRPLLPPSQLSRSGTVYSRESSTGQ